jgi:hypothetical protein
MNCTTLLPDKVLSQLRNEIYNRISFAGDSEDIA